MRRLFTTCCLAGLLVFAAASLAQSEHGEVGLGMGVDGLLAGLGTYLVIDRPGHGISRQFQQLPAWFYYEGPVANPRHFILHVQPHPSAEVVLRVLVSNAVDGCNRRKALEWIDKVLLQSSLARTRPYRSTLYRCHDRAMRLVAVSNYSTFLVVAPRSLLDEATAAASQ